MTFFNTPKFGLSALFATLVALPLQAEAPAEGGLTLLPGEWMELEATVIGAQSGAAYEMNFLSSPQGDIRDVQLRGISGLNDGAPVDTGDAPTCTPARCYFDTEIQRFVCSCLVAGGGGVPAGGGIGPRALEVELALTETGPGQMALGITAWEAGLAPAGETTPSEHVFAIPQMAAEAAR